MRQEYRSVSFLKAVSEREKDAFPKDVESVLKYLLRYVGQHQVLILNSKKDKEKLYSAVYESKEWLNTFRPKVMRLIDINSILVHNLSATEFSKIK